MMIRIETLSNDGCSPEWWPQCLQCECTMTGQVRQILCYMLFPVCSTVCYSLLTASLLGPAIWKALPWLAASISLLCKCLCAWCRRKSIGWNLWLWVLPLDARRSLPWCSSWLNMLFLLFHLSFVIIIGGQQGASSPLIASPLCASSSPICLAVRPFLGTASSADSHLPEYSSQSEIRLTHFTPSLMWGELSFLAHLYDYKRDKRSVTKGTDGVPYWIFVSMYGFLTIYSLLCVLLLAMMMMWS